MKVLFISLGCDKNLVDSEFMLGKLTHHKFTVTDDEQEADIIVINTCCFIHDAKEESIQSILDMAQYRTGGNCKALIVCGCLAERYRDEILKEIPEVDAVLGTNSTEQICDAIEKVLLGDKYEAYEPQQTLYLLHYSVHPWRFPFCTDGRDPESGTGSGRSRSQRTDSGRTGDDTVRY